MEITEVKIFPVQEEKLKAFVSVVLDECFMVNDIKIISGRDGYFISMPSRRKKNGKFKDVAHPLNNETRKAMESRILGEYRRIVEGDESEVAEPAPQRPSLGDAGTAKEPPPTPHEDSGDRSLDEVAEAHLKDSFWGT